MRPSSNCPVTFEKPIDRASQDDPSSPDLGRLELSVFDKVEDSGSTQTRYFGHLFRPISDGFEGIYVSQGILLSLMNRSELTGIETR